MLNSRNYPPSFFVDEDFTKDTRTSIEKLEIYVEEIYKDDMLFSLIDEVKQRIQLIGFTNRKIRELEDQMNTFGTLNSDERIELHDKKKLLIKLIDEV